METDQLLKLLGCTFLCLAALFLVLRWNQNKTGANLLTPVRDWCQAIKLYWRMRRDPEFMRQIECYSGYEGHLNAMSAVRAQCADCGRQLEGGLTAARRARIEGEYLEFKRLEAKCVVRAGHYLAALSDEKIGHIASFASQRIYDGLIMPDEIAAFLRDERDLCRQNYDLADAHPARSAIRFQQLFLKRRDARDAAGH